MILFPLWSICLFPRVDSSLLWSWSLQVLQLLAGSFQAPSGEGVASSRMPSMTSCCWCSFLSGLASSFPQGWFSALIYFFCPFFSSFLRQLILFTKVGVEQELREVTTTHASLCFTSGGRFAFLWVPALGCCQSLGPAVLPLPDQCAGAGWNRGAACSLSFCQWLTITFLSKPCVRAWQSTAWLTCRLLC